MEFEFDVDFKMFVIHGVKCKELLSLVILFYSNKCPPGNTTCALVSSGNNLDNNFLTIQGMGVALCKEPVYMCWLIPDLAMRETWTVKTMNLSNLCACSCVFWMQQVKKSWVPIKISGEIPPQRCSGVSDSQCLAASGH